MVCAIAIGAGAPWFPEAMAWRNIGNRRIRARALMNEGALRGTEDTEGVSVPQHGQGSSVGLCTHAARALRGGGDRRKSCATESRSTTCMTPPQRGHFHSERLEGVSVEAVTAAGLSESDCWSNRKHKRRSGARLRFARNPKLRIRTNLGGSRWSRNRRRNSSIERLMIRWRLP